MHMKRFLFGIIAYLTVGSVNAQDRLYMKDGAVEEVKLTEIGPRNIKYKKWDNLDGPDYVIPKNEVRRIKYQNGDEEIIDRRGEARPVNDRTRRASGVKYGKNIIAFAPIEMNNTSATGLGISYERVLDKNYIISFILPATYSFRSESGYDYMTNATGNRYARMLWISPGLKFYPAGSNHKVTYAVGPNVVFATGTEPQYGPVVVNGVTVNQFVDRDVFMMGFMITNYLNIQPSPKIYLGLQMALGIPYVTEENVNGYSDNYKYYNKNANIPLINFGFRVGYRF